MYLARLLMLAFCIALSVPSFATAHNAPHAAALTGSAAERVTPRTIIEARSLVELVHSNRRVQVKDAIIRGALNLSYKTINQQVSLVNCEFEEPADFSYSVFKRHLILRNSTFKKGFDFEGATLEMNGRFAGIKVLSGKADFHDLHVDGLLNVEHAQFDSNANFSNAHIDKGAYLSGIVFGGEVWLNEMKIGGDLVLTCAHFKKNARFATTKIGGSLFLESAQFEGPAHFAGIETAYSAKLPKAIFKQRVGFNEIEVHSFLNLSGAKFEWSRDPVLFHRAHVMGGSIFDNVHFAGNTEFDNAYFNGDASFENTVFNGITKFNRAHFGETAHFETSVFKQDAIFNETSFGTAEFAPTGTVIPRATTEVNDKTQNENDTEKNKKDCAPNKDEQIQIKKATPQDQFQGGLDLSGSTYHRIQLHWQSALRMPDGTKRLMGNDQQTYSELEKFLKDTGDDDGADGVSLEWHRIKRQELFHTSKIEWLLDCVSWLLTKYGIAPSRLLDLSAGILVFGMVIFSLPGAVTAREGKQEEAEPLTIGEDITLNHWDAFALSLHEFLPLEVPFGSRWSAGYEPVHLNVQFGERVLNVVTMRPSTCATLLRICGYILVPLQILLVNGLIRGG